MAGMPQAPQLTPIPKEVHIVNLKLDENLMMVLCTLIVAGALFLGFFFLFEMFQNNAANADHVRETRIAACKTINTEQLRRDCINGVHMKSTTADVPTYADK